MVTVINDALVRANGHAYVKIPATDVKGIITLMDPTKLDEVSFADPTWNVRYKSHQRDLILSLQHTVQG